MSTGTEHTHMLFVLYTSVLILNSFGIVLWEIWSRELPFPQYRFNYEVEDAVMRGERPVVPEDSPQLYNALMQKCWQHHPRLRPSFSYIVQQLEHIESD